jgi:hypothetical protein
MIELLILNHLSGTALLALLYTPKVEVRALAQVDAEMIRQLMVRRL